MYIITQIIFLVHYGIGAAAAISIAHHVGRNDWTEVRRVAFTAYGMSLCVGALLTAATFFTRHQLISMFTADADVIACAALLFLPFIAYQLGDCTQIIFSNALRGIGRVKTMITDAFFSYIIVSIPLSYLFAFPLGQGVTGVWWGIPFGLTTAGVIFLLRFRKHSQSH